MSTYCAIHDTDEPDRPGDYAACLECGHVYRTRIAFWWTNVASEIRLFPAIIRHRSLRYLAECAWTVLTIGADDLPYCPHCNHDWRGRR